MQNVKSKMENERAKFKKEFRERLYQLVLKTLKLLTTLPKNEVVRVIINQLTRSITSILANYVEAQSASSKREFANFFQYSLKSANESAVWLELLRDTGNGNQRTVEELLQELQEITRIFASSIIKLKSV